FLYWGSMRRGRFGDAIRDAIQAHGRDRVIVVIQSYTRLGATMRWSLEWGLRRLGLSYADFLLLGWWNRVPWGSIAEAAEKLREQGLTRHVMVSGHNRPMLARIAETQRFDALMVRYNAAHRGAEREVFPALGEGRPGMVAYTATRW